MTQDNELLPCPFCGAPAFAHELEAHEHSTFLKTLIPGMPDHSGSYVIEGSCECGSGLMADTREQVVAMWNRRAPDARDARIAELEAARIAYASEFPLNADGDPDVGNIHANIRKLKAELAALKAPAPILSNSAELEPATPWYPDDSGEWVEVPEDLAEMPAALSSETLIEGLTKYERDEQVYSKSRAKARDWAWTAFPYFDNRIVAYKVVKP